MTKNTCVQKVAVIIFLCIFVSSFSPVVAPRNYNLFKTRPNHGGASSSNTAQFLPHRELEGTVRVVLPQNPYASRPDTIVVLLKGVGQQRKEIELSECPYESDFVKKCAYHYEPFQGSEEKFRLGVEHGGDEKQTWLHGQIDLRANETVTKNITYDISGRDISARTVTLSE